MITAQQIDAIYKLYSNAVRTIGNIVYDAENNEIFYDLEAVNAQVEKDKAGFQTIIDTKASALAKLAKLGLTEDEVKALVG